MNSMKKRGSTTVGVQVRLPVDVMENIQKVAESEFGSRLVAPVIRRDLVQKYRSAK